MAQIIPPTPLPNGKKSYFKALQNKFEKSIWILKLDTPLNQTEAVLFLTKMSRRTLKWVRTAHPKLGVFPYFPKYSIFVASISQLTQKLQQ